MNYKQYQLILNIVFIWNIIFVAVAVALDNTVLTFVALFGALYPIIRDIVEQIMDSTQ